MRSDIHPDYREVVFQDTSSDLKFITRSTIDTDETIEWEDGKTYPFAKVEISSQSHPFYTGKQILVDSGGRVERFRRRYGRGGAPAPAPEGPAPVAAAPAPAVDPAQADPAPVAEAAPVDDDTAADTDA